ncbi:MAG: chromosome segregation ATPase [Cognaticolwellia sp.]|jgi:chromosome segregation ATPase
MSDRLQALQGELQTVLDGRMGELRAAIENAESATKGIVSAELEIARNEQTAATLAQDTERLGAEQAKSQERSDQAQSANTALRKERDELALILQGVDEEGGDLRVEVSDLQSKVHDSETSNARLQAEQDSLRGKLKNLEDTGIKMRALKAELMSSIQQNMDELSGGK